METKLCRICGRCSTVYQDIFKIEGLKHKIETCLPIIVSRYCLLPDTICEECSESVTKFYHFIKKSLQSIIILESQYDVTESCLKSKRKHEKGCSVTFANPIRNVETQTEDKYDILLTKFGEENFKKLKLPLQGCDINLVDYDIQSEISETDNSAQNQDVVIVNPKENHKRIDNFLDNLLETKTVFTKQYFSNLENDFISEIVQRKSVKRKGDIIENFPVKICKVDNGSRRKGRLPKKIENRLCDSEDVSDSICEVKTQGTSTDNIDEEMQMEKSSEFNLLQVCLLCQEHFTGPAALAAHVFDVHELDFTQLTDCSLEKKKKIPNLLKISDMKRSSSTDENHQNDWKSPDNVNFSTEQKCQICPHSTHTKKELYSHCLSNHVVELPMLCGICCQPMTSLLNLKNHLKICAIEYPITSRYYCSVCKYGEEGMRAMEHHVLVHDFLLDMCKKEIRMFDPADYVELNPSCELGPVSPTSKNLTCNLCFQANFQSFKDFSEHRRKQHSKFHCDLCNKFYGRNSHLWKHVNRLHKNHPSVTCQICYKTSASKYHLGQHFAKIHAVKEKNARSFANARPYLNYELDKKSTSSEFDATSDQENSDEVFAASENATLPKEVDASSDLYTNIITNYTPPPNKGEFKCPKCSKAFSKKVLLKKHKKNCRPKLQKDLLTRCKTCARIFKDRQSLAKHLVNYHSEYTCEICDQKAQSKCEIVSHIRFTHPNCELFCDVCGNILRSKQNLSDHLSDHANSYVCQFCGDALTSKIKLKMHILSLHRKILSLSCGICLKLFENQHILRNHVQLSHKEDLRPFTSCTVCGKNYGSKWKTYDHLNKSHGRIFKACKTCLEIFNSEQELNAHCEDAHCGKNLNAKNVYLKQEYEEVDESEDEKQAFPSFSSDFSKISLLEKRLVGKKLHGEGATTKVVKTKQKKLSEDENCAQQSGTKRTVYENSDSPSLCEICFKTWPAKKHLWQHYIRCHKSVAATVCGICLKTNTDYNALQQHLRVNHPTLLHGQGFGSNFICRICGRYHNASSKLKLHMAIHEGFDWGILESKSEDKVQVNGTSPANFEDNEGYFESMIEQVECSSNEEESDEKGGNNSSSFEESESDSEDTPVDGENGDLPDGAVEFQSSESDESSSDSCSSEDGDETVAEGSNTASSNDPTLLVNGLGNSNSNDLLGDSSAFVDNAMFRFKTEELDSAVKSISMECGEAIKEELDMEYCELPMTSALNEREIESAVGSIL